MIKVRVLKISGEGPIPVEMREALVGCVLAARPGNSSGLQIETSDAAVALIFKKYPGAKQWWNENRLGLQSNFLLGEDEYELVRPE